MSWKFCKFRALRKANRSAHTFAFFETYAQIFTSLSWWIVCGRIYSSRPLVFQYPPFVYLHESGNGTAVFTGYVFSVLDILAEKFDFSWVIIVNRRFFASATGWQTRLRNQQSLSNIQAGPRQLMSKIQGFAIWGMWVNQQKRSIKSCGVATGS